MAGGVEGARCVMGGLLRQAGPRVQRCQTVRHSSHSARLVLSITLSLFTLESGGNRLTRGPPLDNFEYPTR